MFWSLQHNLSTESVLCINPSQIVCHFGIYTRFSFVTTAFQEICHPRISDNQSITLHMMTWTSANDSSRSYTPGCNSDQSKLSVNFAHKWTTRVTLTCIAAFSTTTNHILSEPVFQSWIIVTFLIWMHWNRCHKNRLCIALIYIFFKFWWVDNFYHFRYFRFRMQSNCPPLYPNLYLARPQVVPDHLYRMVGF